MLTGFSCLTRWLIVFLECNSLDVGTSSPLFSSSQNKLIPSIRIWSSSTSFRSIYLPNILSISASLAASLLELFRFSLALSSWYCVLRAAWRVEIFTSVSYIFELNLSPSITEYTNVFIHSHHLDPLSPFCPFFWSILDFLAKGFLPITILGKC